MLILGLDPGSRHTGYGLLDRQGSQLRIVECGRLSLDPAAELADRLAELTRDLEQLLDRFSPDAVALESLFHGLNVRSLIVLAEARGAILALLGRRRLAVAEYSPAEVKRALTGYGRADKDQVARMVSVALGLRKAPAARDATDALAVAICFSQRYQIDRLKASLGGS